MPFLRAALIRKRLERVFSEPDILRGLDEREASVTEQEVSQVEAPVAGKEVPQADSPVAIEQEIPQIEAHVAELEIPQAEAPVAEQEIPQVEAFVAEQEIPQVESPVADQEISHSEESIDEQIVSQSEAPATQQEESPIHDHAEIYSETDEIPPAHETLPLNDENIHVPEGNNDILPAQKVQEETSQESEPIDIAPETQSLPAEILEAVEPKSQKDYSGSQLDYDFTSGERYVDTVSTKTEFDKMLDELSAISGELLSHEVEKFAKKFTGKFQGDFDEAEANAQKYEAFLGGYITNAATILDDNGYRDAAIKKLEQAKSILETKKKLAEETEATRQRIEQNDDAVDLSDILGLIGD